MTVERIFLGWDGPALPRAADALRARFGDDFDNVSIALPGARAGRRLEELLIERCTPSWIPPRIATIGPITDSLVRFTKPRASDLAREIAWMNTVCDSVLRESDTKVPHTVLTQRPPERGDFAGWAALAGQVRGLHQELAAERKRFADVVPCPLLPAGEQARWRELDAVQRAYANLIERCGLGDPHLERLRALETNAPLRSPKALVLVGVTTVNGLQRELLSRAATQSVPVIALVVAPESEADGFDEFGLLHTEKWQDRAVPLDDSRWRVADRPSDQAAEAAAFLTAACGGRPDGRASVAVLQPEVTPFLARRLSELDSGLRPAVGRSISETAPGRLLEALRAFLEGRQPRTFAALVRHPDLAAALATEGDLGAACDEFFASHLPSRLDGTWPSFEEGKTPWYLARLRDALRALEKLGGALLTAEDQPVAAWPREVRRLLRGTYAARLSREDAEAVDKIADALDEVSALPAPLAAERLDAAEFLRLLMHACGTLELVPDPALRGLESLGWLELPLDEAPALCVTGFQLGTAPEAVHGHPFLPESLRVALGLPSNDDRRARDVCALHVLVHARERLLFVSGQRGTAGDPWLPSPLVFQCADAAARVKAFFRAPEARATASAGTTTPWVPPNPPASRARSAVPPPGERPFSASALNSYLKSPRLYWLEKVLRLATVEPEPHEMDALVFGVFTHAVLAEFHTDPACAELRDGDALAGAVIKRMRDAAERQFGRRPLAAVRLQLAQLESRLRAWAWAEAASRREGWRTIHVEWSAPDAGVPVTIEVDGMQVAFALGGRMDRVDRRETPAGGVELRVLDYKSGENAKEPAKAFKAKAHPPRWEDLQLPIYRRLAAAIEPGATIRLGWFNLPRAVEDTGIASALWGEPELALADEAVARAVLGIRAGEFDNLGNVNADYLSPAMLALLGAAPRDPELAAESGLEAEA